MEIYVSDEIEIKRQNSIRVVHNDNKVYLMIVDGSKFSNLTINYFFPIWQLDFLVALD